jgi:osmotically inducible protein OsmC
MPTRTAKTAWIGALEDGTGTIEMTSSGVGRYEVSFPKRASESADGATSPEELIAAAHSSCYAMQLSALLAAAGASPERLEVSAAVTLRPDPAGGFRISGIALTVFGTVSGIDSGRFHEVAEQAKATCPVSKALTGTEVTLEAQLT